VSEYELEFAWVHFDKIKLRGVQQRLAGRGDQYRHTFAADDQVIIAFAIESHAVDKFTVVVNFGSDTQGWAVGLFFRSTGDLDGSGSS
jgi:hypothetical protein